MNDCNCLLHNLMSILVTSAKTSQMQETHSEADLRTSMMHSMTSLVSSCLPHCSMSSPISLAHFKQSSSFLSRLFCNQKGYLTHKQYSRPMQSQSKPRRPRKGSSCSSCVSRIKTCASSSYQQGLSSLLYLCFH